MPFSAMASKGVSKPKSPTGEEYVKRVTIVDTPLEI